MSSKGEERKSALQNSRHVDPLGSTPVKERMCKLARVDSPFPETQVDAHMSSTDVLEFPRGFQLEVRMEAEVGMEMEVGLELEVGMEVEVAVERAVVFRTQMGIQQQV